MIPWLLLQGLILPLAQGAWCLQPQTQLRTVMQNYIYDNL